MGIQSIVLSLIGLVNLALNTMSLPCLRRGERRRWLLVFSRYQSYRIHTPLYIPLSLSLFREIEVRKCQRSRTIHRRLPLLTNARLFPIFILFSSNSWDYQFRKQSNEKNLKINIEILGWTYSYANDKWSATRPIRRRIDVYSSLFVLFFPFLDYVSFHAILRVLAVRS